MSTWIEVAAVAALGVLAAPSVAQAAPAGIAASGVHATVAGVGQVALVQPDAVGHRVWFGVLASKQTDGSTRGRFWYQHLLPDGSVLAQSWAEVTCLQVTGNVALFTAVVPEGVGPVKNHAFAMKIIDGGALPDQVAFIQAGGGADRPPTGCLDFDVEYPGIPRLPVDVGGYTIHGH